MRHNLHPQFRFGNIFEWFVCKRDLRRLKKQTINSGIFDEEWYLEHNEDVKNAGMRGLDHFVRHGQFEGRNPNPFFDIHWYRSQYPDVAAAQINPIIHYLKNGEQEGRRPSPVFSPRAYQNMTGIEAGRDGRLLASFLREWKALCAIGRLNLIARVHNSGPREKVVFAEQPEYQPLISVILPVFNSDTIFLREAVESVLLQSYGNWELIIVDDASTSNEVVEILREYDQRDKRIKVCFCETNGGIARASQIGLEASVGDYVSFLDHDDVLVDSALNDVVLFLTSRRDVDYTFTDHGMIDPKSLFIHAAPKPGWSPELLLSTNYIVHFKVARRETILKIGGFRPDSQVIQDLDISLRLLRHGAKIAHLPLMLYFWRTHPKSVASGTRAKPSIERLALQIYNEHLEACGSKAVAHWPSRFRSSKVGAYKLIFPDQPISSRSIIVSVQDGSSFDMGKVRTLCAEERFHIVWRDPTVKKPEFPGVEIHDGVSADDFSKVVSHLHEDVLIFVRSSARLLHRNWVNEISGYLDLSDDIGLVGGKILDDRLKVAAGPILYAGGLKPLFAGASDDADGVWLNMQVASNVAAVSSALMAIRRNDLITCGSQDLDRFRDYWGFALSKKVSRLGKRVVFNPWSKIVDKGSFFQREGLENDLRRSLGSSALEDQYYNPSFSQNAPYSLD